MAQNNNTSVFIGDSDKLESRFKAPSSIASLDSFASTNKRSVLSSSFYRYSKHTLNAYEKRAKYLRRLVHFHQMDFRYALWQMWHLFVSPQKVYRNFLYRKQNRDQYARDDPAFLVLLALCLIFTSLGFSLVLGFSASHTFKFLLWVVFIDCIGLGIIVATIFWLMANHCFRCTSNIDSNSKKLAFSSMRGSYSSQQDLVAPSQVVKESDEDDSFAEWGYAFDIHLNAFFPLLIILHLFQLPFIPHIILKDMFISRLIGNTFWLVAVDYYIYITYLGFSSMRFLKKTEVLLYCLTLSVTIYILSLVLNLNFTRGLCFFYDMRVR